MTSVNDWSNTAIGNDRADPPNYMKEGATAVPVVNNWGREVQAAVRRFFETIEWRNFLEDGEEPTVNSSTSFDVPAGVEVFFNVDQRVRVFDSVLYASGEEGTITDVTGTTVTVEMDNAVDIENTVSGVEVGLDPTGKPIYVTAVKNAMALAPPVIPNSTALLDAAGNVISSELPITNDPTLPNDNTAQTWAIKQYIATFINSVVDIDAPAVGDGYIDFFGVLLNYGKASQGNPVAITFAKPYDTGVVPTPLALAEDTSNLGAGTAGSGVTNTGMNLYVPAGRSAVWWFTIGPGTATPQTTWPDIINYSFVSSEPHLRSSESCLAMCLAGTRIYVGEGAGNRIIIQWNLTPGYDINALGSVASFFNPDLNDMTSVNGAWLSEDGSRMWLCGDGGISPRIVAYTLPAAGLVINSPDPRVPVRIGHIDVSALAGITDPQDLCVKPDGTRIIVSEDNTQYQIDLGTAWLPSSAAYNAVSAVANAQSRDAYVTPDGQFMYVFSYTGNPGFIRQFPFATDWDLATLGAVHSTLDVTGTEPVGRGMYVTPETLIYLGQTALFRYDAP